MGPYKIGFLPTSETITKQLEYVKDLVHEIQAMTVPVGKRRCMEAWCSDNPRSLAQQLRCRQFMDIDVDQKRTDGELLKRFLATPEWQFVKDCIKEAWSSEFNPPVTVESLIHYYHENCGMRFDDA